LIKIIKSNKERFMSIILVGGMDRLERHYLIEAEKLGIDLKFFSKAESSISSKIGSADAMVIFTNKISHRVKNEVMNAARSRNIPVMMYHSCGVCTLRDCLNCLKKIKGDCLNG
jgi:hypothetical protein